VVLDHENVHDAHDIGVNLKRKVSGEVGATARVASHAHNLLDDIGADDREVTHKLGDKERSILMSVTRSVTEGISDKSREVNHFHRVSITQFKVKVKGKDVLFFVFLSKPSCG
jgi:hypothetical protein|tara:strand:- start:277 stop:615 length:339 start_codon:yes stop_codon:yes gene_type:complete